MTAADPDGWAPGEDLPELARRVQQVFEEIHREVFAGDPVANPRLRVEVRDAVTVADTLTLVLLTPWTINGLIFPPDDALPASLRVGGRDLPVFAHELDDVGPYRSVNLVSQPTTCRDQEHARELVAPLAAAFREAVARAREAEEVVDPGRRRFLTGGGGT